MYREGELMKIVAKLLVALVAIEHLGIAALEMFFWNTPYAHKAFAMTPDFASASSILAANQGFYNALLAAGLLWGLISRAHGYAFMVFFLGCVIAAGLFGGATAKPSIFLVQALPAAIALLAVLFAYRRE
jgi:putative membrane protein